MTTSSHLAIRAAIAALMLSDPPLAGGRVDEQRDLTLPSGVACSLAVFRENARADAGAILHAPIDWETRYRIAAKARSTALLPADVAVDELVQLAYARLMADATLGGIADDIEIDGIAWDQDDVDTAVALAVLTFTVSHRTASGTI